MHFELTASLLNDILFAMEDQTTKRLVDARKGVLVLEEESSGTVADEEFLYALPEWTSNDGFTMRSGFVENLHSPLAREELRLVLESRTQMEPLKKQIHGSLHKRMVRRSP